MKPREQLVHTRLTWSISLLTLIMQFVLVCISKGGLCRKQCYCDRKLETEQNVLEGET